MIRRVALFSLLILIACIRARGGGPDKDHPFVNSLEMRFVPVVVPGGKPVLFSIWKTRVKDFTAFVDDTHYDATKDMLSVTPIGNGPRIRPNWKAPGFEQSEMNPVCGVNYADAVAFCAWLSKKEGKHYRLPTDREWSCAVGIGEQEQESAGPRGNDRRIKGIYPWGTQWPPPKGAGNYAGEECKLERFFTLIHDYRDAFVFTSPVGTFDANPLGLYDMGGNLCEWCDDWMDADHRHRVLRGSSFSDCAPACLLSSFRRHDLPENRGLIYGFRVVLEQ